MKKKKYAKYIFIIIGSVLFLTFSVGLVRFLMLRRKYKRYLERGCRISNSEKLDIVGMLDSYGVPYSPSVDKSFFQIITEELQNSGQLGSALDLYNLYANKTWAIQGIFDNGVTIGELKTIQNFSISFTKHKYPDMVKENIYYTYPQELKEKTLFDYIRGLDNPVILYSCSANDLFYYYNTSLEGINIKKIYRIIKHLDDATERLSKSIRSNIEAIKKCNPNAIVLVMGLYIPSDNFLINSIGNIVISRINKSIKMSCQGIEGAHFVDVSCLSFGILKGDFHPNQDGQRVLAAIIAEKIDKYVSKDLSNKKKVSNETWKESHQINDSKFHFNDTEIIKKSRALYSFIVNKQVILDDYVKCAVIFEEALYELNLEQIDYRELIDIKEEMLKLVDSSSKEYWEMALDVEISEKKMLNGITESDHALSPVGIKNDKLSYKIE